MSIAVTCLGCGSSGRVADKFRGANVKCPNCGKRIFVEPAEPIAPVTPVAAPALKACPFCAEEIQSTAIKCKHCGEFLAKKPENPEKSGQWNGVAALLSLLWPGVGQIYKGEVLSGLAWSLLLTIGYGGPVMIAVNTNEPAPLVLTVLGFVFHLVCIKDAGLSTKFTRGFHYSALRMLLLFVVLLAILRIALGYFGVK